jgi:hypothetical protein
MNNDPEQSDFLDNCGLCVIALCVGGYVITALGLLLYGFIQWWTS